MDTTTNGTFVFRVFNDSRIPASGTGDRREAMSKIVRDFRIAVGQDCMGWFCEKYGIGALEFKAKSSLHLIELVIQWLQKEDSKGSDE